MDLKITKILKGTGIGGLYLGGGVFYVLFGILQFLVPAVVGLLMIWWAITEFIGGSIITGLLILLIGAPIAVGISSYAFIFVFILGIISLIIWGVANLFGAGLSFGNAWSLVWFLIKILILGSIAFAGSSGLIKAIKTKQVATFFKRNWFYLLIFIFLLWIFF